MKATRRIKTVEERFYPKLVKRPSGCIEWAKAKGRGGYGVVNVGPAFSEKKQWMAHRLAWTLANGPIPTGLVVCHKCDNPPCCNVDHLFLGTMADNNADRDRKGRNGRVGKGAPHQEAKTHCPQGHPYDEANTYSPPGKTWRHCRICQREANRKSAAKRQALRLT